MYTTMEIGSNLFNFSDKETKEVSLKLDFTTETSDGSNSIKIDNFFEKTPDYYFRDGRECCYAFTCFCYEIIILMRTECIGFKHNFTINIPLRDYNSDVEKYSITFKFDVNLEGFKQEDYTANTGSNEEELKFHKEILQFEDNLKEKLKEVIVKFQSHFPEEGFLP